MQPKSCNCSCRAPARYQTTQFPKLINTNNQSVVTIYLWQASDNVYHPILKPARGYWQRLQQPSRCLVNVPYSLTNRTTSYILTYISLHTWPPDTLLQSNKCFASTKMQSICGVVQLSYKLPTTSIVLWQHQLQMSIIHNLLQDAVVGRVCGRAHIRSPTAAELAHAKSMLGMPE